MTGQALGPSNTSAAVPAGDTRNPTIPVNTALPGAPTGTTSPQEAEGIGELPAFPICPASFQCRQKIKATLFLPPLLHLNKQTGRFKNNATTGPRFECEIAY